MLCCLNVPLCCGGSLLLLFWWYHQTISLVGVWTDIKTILATVQELCRNNINWQNCQQDYNFDQTVDANLQHWTVFDTEWHRRTLVNTRPLSLVYLGDVLEVIGSPKLQEAPVAFTLLIFWELTCNWFKLIQAQPCGPIVNIVKLTLFFSLKVPPLPHVVAATGDFRLVVIINW